MKKPYNEIWIENLQVQRICKDWLNKKLITSQQNDLAKIAYPQDFYLPGIFVRIGLFIFAMMGCSFFTGFISMFFVKGMSDSFIPVSVLSAIVFFFYLEFLIKDRKLFHSGIDNALLYSAVTSLLIPIVIFFENRLEVWQYCVIGLLIIGVATYRYADLFLAGCSYAILFTLLGNLMIKFPLGKALLPFAVMTLALVIYFTSKQIRSSYYHPCSRLIQILALLTFYVGGNYYVVREANAVLNNFPGPVSPQIAFAGLFYFFTAIIPLAYIYFGIKFKSRIFLVTGLVCLAFSFFTVQYYTDYLTIPQALSVAGVIMILLSSGLIHFLKEPVIGISDNQENDNGRLLQIQTLLAAEYLGAPPQQQDGFDFGGGGEFSGGGAGSNY